MIRLGLCCMFIEEPIKFHHTTLTTVKKLSSRDDQIAKLDGLALGNAKALLAAVKKCHELKIGAFRVFSQIMPLYSHPEFGYKLDDLPSGEEVKLQLEQVKEFACQNDIRLSFHPDQFVILSSPSSRIVENSIRELEYQCTIADLIGANTVNIHLGGVYGDKAAAIKRFGENYCAASSLIKRHLTLENDDISYNVADLYPICMEHKIPLVYDVHHHRCLPDQYDIKTATQLARETWLQVGKEPHFHISSPLGGWESSKPRIHADYIDAHDFPKEWLECEFDFTVDIEAKAKEKAVKSLQKDLSQTAARQF